VRDFASFAFCQQRLPVNAPLKLMADSALLLKPGDADHVEDIFLQENIDLAGRPLIGFALKGPIRDRRQIASLARAIDMANTALGGGAMLVPYHRPEDLEYAEAVRAMCEDKESVAVVKGMYRPDEVLGLVGKCDLMVGMRLHSLIFAASRGVPFVPVSYDPKIDEFSREFGLRPAVHTPLVGPEKLVETIEETWETRGRIKAKLTQGMVRLEQRTRDGFNALGEFLDSLELRRIGLARKVKAGTGAKKRKEKAGSASREGSS
jgi:polysaccharide pyruvyl transferase WcaK-like protein